MKKYYSDKNENIFDHLPLTFHIDSHKNSDFLDFMKTKETGFEWNVKS